VSQKGAKGGSKMEAKNYMFLVKVTTTSAVSKQAKAAINITASVS